jgi:hypothetical protein
VLELKMKFRENLLALDNHLVDISKNIDGMPWELNFQNRITDFIDKRIQPEITNLRKNVKSSPPKIANKIYEAARANLALSFAFYGVFPNFLREIIIGASAITFLDLLRTTYQETKKFEENSPYSIFMKVRKT